MVQCSFVMFCVTVSLAVKLAHQWHRHGHWAQGGTGCSTHLMTCMKLLASSIPGSESANSVSSSLARPDSPARGREGGREEGRKGEREGGKGRV